MFLKKRRSPRYGDVKIKRNKYGNKRVKIDGINFQSKAEGERYLYLKSQVKAGKISQLQTQVAFYLNTISPEKPHVYLPVGRYIADFVYTKDGKTVVEDVKGVETSIFKWKRKHFEIQYSPLKIQVIKASDVKKETI